MITFGTPLALMAVLALLPIALAALLATRSRRRAGAQYASAPILRGEASRRMHALRLGLLLAAIACIALAAARPRWGTHPQPLTRSGIDVAIALDISRSMQAADVAPSRAGAAAAGLHDMLMHLRGDRVGLVTFAGSVFERSPLSLDTGAVSQLVAGAQAEAPLVQHGTDIGQAILAALRILDADNPAATRVIVLITDGEDLGNGIDDAIGAAQRRNVRIYTVVAGTAQGAPLPPVRGATQSDTTVSRADQSTLERIAHATGGDMRPVGTLAGLAVEFAGLRRSELDRAIHDTAIERFQWFIAAALALLALRALIGGVPLPTPLRAGYRATALSMVAAFALLGCGAASAWTLVHRGNAAYARERYQQALDAYQAARTRDPVDARITYNAANALYHLGQYQDAATTAGTAIEATTDHDLTRRARYTIGSSAYQTQQYPVARDAFTAVLLDDGSDRDAKRNLELTLRALHVPPEVLQPDAPATPGGAPTTNQEQRDLAPGRDPGQTRNGGTTDATTPSTPDRAGSGNAGGAPGPLGRPGNTGSPVDTATAARDAAAAELRGALDALQGQELTAEEAQTLLDMLRQLASMESLGGDPGAGDPTDR